MNKEYWLVTIEYGNRQTRVYETISQHPVDYLLSPALDGLSPVIIFAMPITKEQYDKHQ